MENSSADQPASCRRARLGAVNPLTVAVGVVLLCAGGAFGWRMRSDAPTARPTPEAAAAALALERVDERPMCSARGLEEVRDVVLRGASPELPDGLGEHLPTRSPLPGYARVSSHAIDAAAEAEFLGGAVEGHVASFRPDGEGGFDVYAYRFLTRRSAADAVAAQVVRRVCDFGARPLEARGRPGLVVLEERGRDWMSAWWLSRSDVIVVKYGGWGDGATSLANLAAVAGATALY
ncbi:MAG TPA: hypothetical protein VHJ76_05815 [Actinomycetota bacterium]|nr:hypothetical protein [Actinomycetota bacterium]